MTAKKLVHVQGQPFDVTSLHGTYCTINMTGQDVGYARVGIVSSGERFVLFRFRGKLGLAAKAYIKDIVPVRMTARMQKKEEPLKVVDWDEKMNPFFHFVGERCDIHMHQTRLFEASPGFFDAKILYVDELNGLLRIKENSKQFNVSMAMICAMLQK